MDVFSSILDNFLGSFADFCRESFNYFNKDAEDAEDIEVPEDIKDKDDLGNNKNDYKNNKE